MKVKCSHQKMVPIAELRQKFHPKNRNEHPPEQIERLAKILEFQGIRRPVQLSNLSGKVVVGHGMILAAEYNGWTELPVDYQDYSDADQEYAHVQADNAIAAWAELNLPDIQIDVKDLNDQFDWDMLGLKSLAFNSEVFEPQADEDEVPEYVEAKTKLGDLYLLGSHRLLCGDSTTVTAMDRLMGEAKADLVFTDPPYGVNYDGGHANSKRRKKLANDGDTSIYDGSVPMMEAYSKPKAALYLWFAATKSLQVLQVLQNCNYEIRSWLIWNKNMAQFGAIGAQYKQKHEPCLYAYKRGNTPFWDGPTNEVSVWDQKRESKNEFHPTQKPVELAQRAITNSCPDGGGVLDLFGGSGATLIACEKTKRSCYMMELDPHYCDVIVARWEKYTGKKAILEQNATS